MPRALRASHEDSEARCFHAARRCEAVLAPAFTAKRAPSVLIILLCARRCWQSSSALSMMRVAADAILDTLMPDGADVFAIRLPNA